MEVSSCYVYVRTVSSLVKMMQLLLYEKESSKKIFTPGFIIMTSSVFVSHCISSSLTVPKQVVFYVHNYVTLVDLSNAYSQSQVVGTNGKKSVL